MKNLVLLVVVLVMLTGCSESVVVYPQDNEFAVNICSVNGGVNNFEVVVNSGMYNDMIITCNDGAVYHADIVRIMTKQHNQNGNISEVWRGYEDHTWKVKK